MNEDRYYWDRLNTFTQTNLAVAVQNGDMYSIIDEIEGGIIAYATDVVMANRIINALQVKAAIVELLDLVRPE